MIRHIGPPIAGFTGLGMRAGWEHDVPLMWTAMGAVIVMLALGIIFEGKVR